MPVYRSVLHAAALAMVAGLPFWLHCSGLWLKFASYFTLMGPAGQVGLVWSTQLQAHTLDVFGPS